MSERWIPFDVADADPDPYAQWSAWYDAALGEVREREAIALATADANGHPSVRMVLLRHFGTDGFGWFTNYHSHKGTDLAANPFASLLWYCEPLGRQVRIDGGVEKMTAAQSDDYFQSRPRGHQVGAHASNQSHPLSTRAELEERVAKLEREFGEEPIPRPAHWGGYLLRPTNFEFWQHRSDRLHDRVLYARTASGMWERQRYAP